VRAAVQLTLVAAALRGVFAAPAAVVAVLAVMFGVATWTAARRLAGFPGAYRAVVLCCGAGAVPAIGIVVGLPMLHRDVRTLVAVSGIVIGGCMTAATLTGRRLADGLHRRRDEIEGWLALGATPREAVRDVGRSAMFDALIPALDQTRTVGLVTLPGTFVGALIGGAGAAGAARFQLTVLVALLCAQSVTSASLIWFLGAPDVLPP
jgi:putative ABC transport system permease protein